MTRASLALALLVVASRSAAADPNGMELACSSGALDPGTPWLYRELGMGYTIPDKTFSLETRTLVLGPGGAVQLIVHELEAPRDPSKAVPDPNSLAWSCKQTKVLRGSASSKGKVLELSLVDPTQSDPTKLSCTYATVRIASEGAVRVRGRSKDETCTTWTWSPAATRASKVVQCSEGTDPLAKVVTFGAAPGIEVANGELDCQEGRALRRIPKDGTLRHVQRPARRP